MASQAVKRLKENLKKEPKEKSLFHSLMCGLLLVASTVYYSMKQLAVMLSSCVI